MNHLLRRDKGGLPRTPCPESEALSPALSPPVPPPSSSSSSVKSPVSLTNTSARRGDLKTGAWPKVGKVRKVGSRDRPVSARGFPPPRLCVQCGRPLHMHRSHCTASPGSRVTCARIQLASRRNLQEGRPRHSHERWRVPRLPGAHTHMRLAASPVAHQALLPSNLASDRSPYRRLSRDSRLFALCNRLVACGWGLPR
ncbi:hypothetical protein AAFF_G00169080 [Aldrovandia affinis]|uniref:Uncharacterized protein n=1 Tax=Aldrovandia affinis TaxID=143900 RepID=A0AAD7RLY9_9TELE|nr:hypothetical protein AAFF_G00169080 [Aldrovandia affinis]